MFRSNLMRCWLASGLVIAAAGFPSVGQAKYGPDAPGSVSSQAPTHSPVLAAISVSTTPIAEQIQMVKSGQAQVSQLGPNARTVYDGGGISAAEPDAQAVGQAQSGSLLTGRQSGLASTAKEQRAAAAVTVSEANAMQAAAVAHGEANSVLSNPYIEQKVTTPESVGVNRTVPAGGF